MGEEKEELVTVKVKKRVYDDILEIQAVLTLKDRRKYSHSDTIEYALTRLPPIGVPLSTKFSVLEPSEVKKK